MSTLQERYKSQLINESLDAFEAEVMTEALDRDTISAAINTVKRLNSINLSSIPTLDQARDNAVQAATSAITGAGDKKSLFKKAVDAFRTKKSPFLDALAFAAALRSFFPMLEKYVVAAATKSGTEPSGDSRLNDLFPDSMHNAVRKIVEQGLQPEGKLSLAGNGWRKQYVKASNDEIVDDVMNLTIDEIKAINKSVTTATGNVARVSQAVNSQSSQDTKSGSQKTVGTDKTSKIADEVKNRLGGEVSPETIKKIVGIMSELGVLK